MIGGLARWADRRLRPSARSLDDFRVVAIISVRDCEPYLDRCFAGMVAQGVEICVIDNDASAATRAIVDRYRGRGVIRVEHFPYPGYFDWIGILGLKERLARTLDADWILLWDSDEIREAPAGYGTLREALFRVDREGFNAVNFDEFVFLPTDREQDFAGRDFVAGLEHYYFFEPAPHHRLSGWKRQAWKVDLKRSAGHKASFPGIRVYPHSFALRHYLFLSWRHGVEKYVHREFSSEELKRGWSAERARTTERTLRLPDAEEVVRYGEDGHWDRSRPRTRHLCFDYEGVAA